MKKIILLLVPIVLTACISSKPTPIQEELPQTNPTINNEVQEPDTAIPEKTTTKTAPTQPTTEKKDTTNAQPDTKTDEMTKELDSIIDDMISGL